MERKQTANIPNAWMNVLKHRNPVSVKMDSPKPLQTGVSNQINLESVSQSDNLLPEITPSLLPTKIIKGAYGVPFTEQFKEGKSKRLQWKRANMTSSTPHFARYSRQQVYKMAGRSLRLTDKHGLSSELPKDRQSILTEREVCENLVPGQLQEVTTVTKAPARDTSDFPKKDSKRITFCDISPQQQEKLCSGSVLQRRSTKFSAWKSLYHLPPSLHNSADLSNPESTDYWVSHVGDPLLDIIFDLYLTENRRYQLCAQEQVPEASIALFNAQRVDLTISNINTFLHDVLAKANAEGTDNIKHAKGQTLVSLLRRQKLPAIQEKDLLETLLGVDPIKLHKMLKKVKEKVLAPTPLTAVMEGPEFPSLVFYKEKQQHARKKRIKSTRESRNMVMPLEETRMMYEKSCYEKQIKIAKEKVKSRWRHLFRLINLVNRISRAIAESWEKFEQCDVRLDTQKNQRRSYAIALESKCFIDIGDEANTKVSYGKGRSINSENYKRKKEITFCNDVRTTLGQLPEHRTLVQLDQAVMELQKITVFSKYPLEIQEKMVRKGLYLRIGPRRVIVRQGQLAQYFYIAVSGEAFAKQTFFDPETGCAIVRTLKRISPGMTFGELAMIRGTRRTASVVSRLPMQLIGVHIEDFYDIFLARKLAEDVPDHVTFLRGIDIMADWPIEQLLQFPSLCKTEYFRNNSVITFDSWNCPNLYIVKTGYCKVFRMLKRKDFREEVKDKLDELVRPTSDTALTVTLKRRDSALLFMSSLVKQIDPVVRYLEQESEGLSFREIQSPRGKAVKLPVVRTKRLNDPIHAQSLQRPTGKRQFVPLKLLGESDVFGLDQLPIFKDRMLSHSVILVSLGAECIALNKTLFCQFANKETSELIKHKAFVYNTDYIKRRLHDMVNIDVHLEHILVEYFYNNLEKGCGKRQ